MPSVVSGLAARTCPRSASMGRRPSRRPASRGSTVRRRGPRLAQCADQILAAVRDMGGADQDPLERPDRADRDPCATWQCRRGRRHPPVRSATGSLGGTRQRRSEHHDIRPGGDRLGELAAALPPSATTGTYRPVSLRYASRAAATSLMAVTCGTPMPRTSRVVHAAPGPTPTKAAAAPAPSTRMRRRRWSCCRPRPGSA